MKKGRSSTSPIGKTVEFGHFDMFKVDRGRITEALHIEDIAGLVRRAASASDVAPA
jgi:hypothetical protein